MFNLHFMKVSTENDNNFGYEKITIVVDNILLIVIYRYMLYHFHIVINQITVNIFSREQSHCQWIFNDGCRGIILIYPFHNTKKSLKILRYYLRILITLVSLNSSYKCLCVPCVSYVDTNIIWYYIQLHHCKV